MVRATLRGALLTGATLIALGTAAHAQTDVSGANTWQSLAQPSPLSAEEEAQEAGPRLARRFNPAMAFTTRDIWPVEVRYAWADGADLIARVLGPDGHTVREYVAREHANLVDNDWGDLPQIDEAGQPIHYFVDAPGDDRLDRGVSRWVRRWRAIMQGDDTNLRSNPAALEYAPTQYAHLFWWNRDRGLLAIQYWFYFPYNEWINHHEGDWEHINVILRGPPTLRGDAGFRPVGYQFFFHNYTLEPDEVIRVASASARDTRDDHVVVYTGGRSRFLMWTGQQSGGSYPLPGLYPRAGGGIGDMKPSDDTSSPARFIRPEDFRIVMLPEPERLDVGQRPELAWLRLAFFAGQAQMFRNPLALNGLVFGEAPRQPARQETWNAAVNPPFWRDLPQVVRSEAAIPHDWVALDSRRAEGAAPELSARRRPARRPHSAK